MTITGLGFGTDESKVKVLAGGQPCEVLESTNEQVTCRVKEGANVQNLVGSQSVRFISYKSKDIGQMRSAAVASNGATIASSIVSQGQLGSFEVMNLEDGVGCRMYGFFRPPKSGEYIFYLSADDTAEVWINLTPNISTLATQTRILNISEWKNWRDTWTKTQKSNERQKSEPVQLVADAYYYIEAYVSNVNAQGFLSLSVETPEL